MFHLSLASKFRGNIILDLIFLFAFKLLVDHISLIRYYNEYKNSKPYEHLDLKISYLD